MKIKRINNGKYTFKDDFMEGYITHDLNEPNQFKMWKVYCKDEEGHFIEEFKGHTLKACKTWVLE